MKKVVYIILVMAMLLITNVILFYFNDSYYIFFKNLKHGNNEKNIITDDYINIDKNLSNCECEKTSTKNVINNLDNKDISINNNSNLDNKNIIIENKIENKNISIDKLNSQNEEKNKQKIQKIISVFNKYNLNLKTYDEYYSLYGLTDEYPIKYLTYNNNKFEIYFFINNDFEKLFDFFSVIDKNKVNIKKTTTFGPKTFFINLKKDDNKIRIVIDNGEIVFGLFIKKSYYEEVKKILQNFNF